jgi:phage head maturation protease
MTFDSRDFAAAPAAPTVDTAARTITGLAVPYNATATKLGAKFSFAPGSLEYSSPDRMAALMDHTTPVGFHRSVTDTADGPVVALHVLDAPEGSPAKMQRDQLLYDAAHGLYSGLSIGVDFSLNPDDGDVEFDEETGTYRVVRATWRETSITYMPAFDDARVTKVAASRTGGNPVDPCQHCGQRHAANISCVSFARQLAAQPDNPTPQPAPTPGTPPSSPPTTPPAPTAHPGTLTPAAFAQMVAAFAGGQPQAVDGGPSPVSPRHGAVDVRDPEPYRFDRHGNLQRGSHDFSSDLLAGWPTGGGVADLAARSRAETFVRDYFERMQYGAANAAAQQFAITPANVVNLNYPQNRPDLYVDQLEYQYPIWNAINKGTLDAVTPFIIPKFNSSSGLVGDHTTGTEPTPGAFTATAQTITPTPVSGKVEITREVFDQGGNPQTSQLIWRQMIRGWFEALESYAVAQLVANAASIPDLTITTAAADATLDQAIATALIPLQYIRGGDRFRTVFTQVDLYTAMAKAKDTTGRRLYPAYGPMNSNGTASPDLTRIDAHGKTWVPAWATAATSVNASSSYMFDPDVVCGWASTPQRLDIVWRVAWVDMGIFGYKAFGVTDFSRTRELVYDPV